MFTPGSIFFVGIPAAALGSTDAANGTSIENGQVVWGNAAGGSAADLQSSRFVNLKGLGVRLVVDGNDGPGSWGFQDIDFDNNGVQSYWEYGQAQALLNFFHSSLSDTIQILANDSGNMFFRSTRTSSAAFVFQAGTEVQLFVYPHTADFLLSPGSNNMNVFTNEGAAAGITFSLPAAEPGFNFSFYVQNVNGVTVDAFAGDTIRWGANVTAAGGSINSVTVGSCITLVAINTTEWVATSIVGTWV